MIWHYLPELPALRQRVLAAYAPLQTDPELEVAYWNGSTWIGANGTGEVHRVYAWAEPLPPPKGVSIWVPFYIGDYLKAQHDIETSAYVLLRKQKANGAG